MWNATQHNLDHISNHGMNIKTRVIQSNSLSFDIKTIILRPSQQTIMSFKISMLPECYPYKIIQSSMLPFPNTRYPSCLSLCQPSNCFILQYSQTFSTLTQYMSVSHGYSTMGGIEYDDGGYVENIKREKVSHRRG